MACSYLYPFFLLLQIFHTPEGMLSGEQGVYVAESVPSGITKESKVILFSTFTRLFIYLFLVSYYNLKITFNLCLLFNQKSTSSNNSTRREPASRESSGLGKKDAGKFAKKAGMSLLCSFFAI